MNTHLMPEPLAALDRLKQGNQRFVSSILNGTVQTKHAQVVELPSEQAPFAIILGCSDSRVPAEIVFDQGLGDLFVIRVAGNIAAPSQIGSIEFAARQFGTRLVVVLGHSHCGAVKATLDGLHSSTSQPSPNLKVIVDQVRPSVEAVLKNGSVLNNEELVEKAVVANIHASILHLQKDSEVLRGLIEEQKLLIVGAQYSLETGKVTFFDQ